MRLQGRMLAKGQGYMHVWHADPLDDRASLQCLPRPNKHLIRLIGQAI